MASSSRSTPCVSPVLTFHLQLRLKAHLHPDDTAWQAAGKVSTALTRAPQQSSATGLPLAIGRGSQSRSWRTFIGRTRRHLWWANLPSRVARMASTAPMMQVPTSSAIATPLVLGKRSPSQYRIQMEDSSIHSRVAGPASTAQMKRVGSFVTGMPSVHTRRSKSSALIHPRHHRLWY